MTGAHVDMPTLPNRPGPLLSTNLAGMGKPSFRGKIITVSVGALS